MPNSSRETGVTLDNIIKSLDLKEGIFKFLNDGSLKNMSATSRYWQAAVKDNGKSVFINRAPEAGDNESLKGLLKDAKKITFSSKISYDQVKSFFEGEQSIGSFSKLKEINFVSSNINSADLQEILKKAPNLEKIDLGGCRNIVDLNLAGINLDKLKDINFAYSNIKSAGLQEILKQAPNLENIDLWGCRNIVDLNLAGINLGKLKDIDLGYSYINSADLQEILKKAPNLENINLGGCDDIATEDRKTFNKSEIASLKDKLGIKGTSPPLTSTAVTSAATISSGPAARSI